MTEVVQKVQLVEGKFTPVEASHIINALIAEKINFHKIQRLNDDNSSDENSSRSASRVKELEDEQTIAKKFISIARREGYNLKINGSIQIAFEN